MELNETMEWARIQIINPFDQFGFEKVDDVKSFKELRGRNRRLQLLLANDHRERPDFPRALHRGLYFLSQTTWNNIMNQFESLNDDNERAELLRYMQELWRPHHNPTWNGRILIDITQTHPTVAEQRQALVDRIEELIQRPPDIPEPQRGWRR